MSAFVPQPLYPLSAAQAGRSAITTFRPRRSCPTTTRMRVAAPMETSTAVSTTTTTTTPTNVPIYEIGQKPELFKPPSRASSSSSSSSCNSPSDCAHMAQVRQYLANHDYDRARAIFNSLVNAPDSVEDAEVLRSWAFMEGCHGDEVLSRRLFQRAIRAAASPDVEAAAWNAWALMEQRKGNISAAGKCFANGLRVDPTHVPLCQAYAMFEAKFGLKRRARELFARGAELNKASHRTWIAWANFEAGQDNLTRARFLLKTAVANAIGEDGVTALLAFARFEVRQKQFGKARDLYREGLVKYGKQCTKILHAWARMESQSGNYERSRQLFLSTLGCPGMSGADAAPTYQAWALAEKKAGNIESARKLFKRGAEANPEHVYIWQAWGVMEHRCGNVEAAREYFRRGVSVDKFNAPTWNAWARLEADERNIEEARRLFGKATTRSPNHAKSWQAWAVLEGRQGNLDVARGLFRKAVAADPTCAPAWQAWGCMEEIAGNVEKARALFQNGVNADPLHIAVWNAWSQMEKRVGEWKSGPACSLPSRADERQR